MITIRIIWVTKTTIASIVETRATATPLVTTISLLLVATIDATCSGIYEHMILLLIYLCLLCHQVCFSVEEMGIESFRTDRISHSIDMLDQRVIFSIQSI
jgi:hypothetical protein